MQIILYIRSFVRLRQSVSSEFYHDKGFAKARNTQHSPYRHSMRQLIRKASASAPTSDPVQGFRAQRSRVSGIKGGLQGSESNGSVYGPLDPNPYTLIEPLYYPDSTFPRPSHPDLLNAACLSSF